MTRVPAVVVLAGGEGVRIGGGKPGRMLGGRSLLDRALERARGWSDLVAVAVRGATPPFGGPIIRDDPDIPGPLGGLASALRFAGDAGAETVLVLPCDMPFLPADLAGRLAEAMGGANAAIASSGGRLHPVCALWRPAALAHLASDRHSLTGLAERAGYVAVEWTAQPVDPFFNVNSEEDLARGEAELRSFPLP